MVRPIHAEGTEKHLCGFIFRISTYKLMRSKQINLINFYIKLRFLVLNKSDAGSHSGYSLVSSSVTRGN